MLIRLRPALYDVRASCCCRRRDGNGPNMFRIYAEGFVAQLLGAGVPHGLFGAPLKST